MCRADVGELPTNAYEPMESDDFQEWIALKKAVNANPVTMKDMIQRIKELSDYKTHPEKNGDGH